MREGTSCSWYLDPVVALQKQQKFAELVARWSPALPVSVSLKTDLFEEANGEDHLLPGCLPGSRIRIGVDLDEGTVRKAFQRFPGAFGALVTDVRSLPFRKESLDLIVSTSTLDHFDDPGEIQLALREMAGCLSPGGRLIVALDNPWNPLYYPLRLVSRMPGFPFKLGKTLSSPQLRDALRTCRLSLVDEQSIIHNPRLLSTVLFLALRWILGASADRPVGALLRLFDMLSHLPSRKMTGCFIVICAERR